ncbi:aldolase/citrate lyase family protein [Gemmatimonas sp.]|uniref:aldolase/citrate lyase family protein n=1 Tax=Gemmatimonas sp. TaxID=1962908 RepID=UPI0037BF11D6
MRSSWMLAASAALSLGLLPPAPLAAQARFNPVIDLLAAKKPVFGLYAPANRRARPGQPAPPADSMKTMAQLAQEALAYKKVDYIFEGTMEYNFDQSFPPFTEFAKAMFDGGAVSGGRNARAGHGLFVKTPEIAPDPAVATARIGKQLNEGVTGIVFVDVLSAEELKKGIAAVRFSSKGGTRSANVGNAPARWGMSEKEYKERADLWPLNPKGELLTFTIVESKEGLSKIREIAAVPGVGVLFPGAGTLRGVFTSTDANGQRKFDEVAWEAAIQSVLAACKEFNVPCGYPAGAADIEMRMKQGFSVFVIGWGEQGFKAVDLGRAASGR